MAVEVVTRMFTGKLNLDSSKYRIPAEDYLDCYNLTRNSQGDYTDGPMTNLIGTTKVDSVLHAGVNKCIGSFPDKLRNRVIEFIYNSQGYHIISTWSRDTNTTTIIFQSKTDSAGIDILNLQLLYKVNDINVIHRDEDGDLLLWNDGYNRPGQLNIDDFIAGLYTPVSDDLIRLDRQPPIDEPRVSYTSDFDNFVNNFRKKLFQFAYAYRYANDEKSTLSPISKIPIPVDAYSVDVDSVPNRNNAIVINMFGGPKDYKSIIVYGRELKAANVFSDWFKIDELNKVDYNIPSGGTYAYHFLNDGEYPTEDVRFTDLAYARSADICRAQGIVNGNYIVQAGVTTGYDAIQRNAINVQITSILKDTPTSSAVAHNPEIGPVFQGIAGNSYYITFPIGPDVGEGSVYRIKFHAPVYAGADFNVDVTYVALVTDSPLDVANGLLALITPQLGPTSFGSVLAPNKVSVNSLDNRPNAYPYDGIVISATPALLKSGGSPTWKWNEKIRLGIVYFDKYGKTNGVVSFISTEDDPTDFSVTTSDFSFNNDPSSPYYGNPMIPVILMSINHLPPAWAVSFTIVRTRNQSVSTFLHYITCEVVNASDPNYYLFCIENLDSFREQNTGFIPSYTFESGDRLRVYAEVIDADPKYVIPATVGDYEILGTIEQDMTGGTNKGTYLKIKKPTGAPVYGPRMMVEIYRPSLRSSEETQVFYTFGETYPIYTGAGGIRYHVGEDQNQTASQPATFTFEDGGEYYKFRDFFPLSAGAIDTANPYSRGVMDANYSDYFNSAVNSNGRPWVIEANAKRLFRPNEMIFSQALNPGTNLNGINIFYPEDFIEVIRDNGEIKRIFPWNNGLITCQENKIGVVPVLQEMTFNVDGSSNLILSSNLLNRIQYFKGEYGIGSVPESLAWNNFSIYGWDNKRGVCWQLVGWELIPISILYKINNFAITEAKQRGFDFKIYGVFDAYLNKYITAFEEIPSVSSSKTLVWDETDKGFESFTNYYPEMMCCLNDLLISFKDGSLYTHDNEEVYNLFYGRVYDSYIKVAFNDRPMAKKSWETLFEQSNVIWEVPEIETTVVSHDDVYQLSTLIASDFELQEDFYQAGLLRDYNSPGRIANGDSLKGAILTAKFFKSTPTSLVFLNAVSITYIDSPLNVGK